MQHKITGFRNKSTTDAIKCYTRVRMQKKKIAARLKRLNRGGCPIHGIYMPQDGPWTKKEGGALDGADVCIVGCPRKDCKIRAWAADVEGPFEILDEFIYLLKIIP